MAILPLLYRVQEIETRLAKLEQELAKLNEDPNLLAAKQLQTQLVHAITDAKSHLKKLQMQQRQLNLELKSSQERLQHEERKLYGGTIVHPRELEQLQQKVDEYKVVVAKNEDELLLLMEADETSVGRLADLKKRQAAADGEKVKIDENIKHQSMEGLFEKEQLQVELDELLSQIPPEWLEKYHRIAKAHRGIGIAKLKQSSCGACHVSLSDSKLRQARRGEDKLDFCENCGRILFYN